MNIRIGVVTHALVAKKLKRDLFTKAEVRRTGTSATPRHPKAAMRTPWHARDWFVRVGGGGAAGTSRQLRSHRDSCGHIVTAAHRDSCPPWTQVAMRYTPLHTVTYPWTQAAMPKNNHIKDESYLDDDLDD